MQIMRKLCLDFRNLHTEINVSLSSIFHELVEAPACFALLISFNPCNSQPGR